MPEDTIITRTETFIESLKKRPIWAASLGLWLVCVSFISNTIWGRAEVYAKVEEYNSRARAVWMTGQKLTLIEKTMGVIWDGAVDSRKFYYTNVLPLTGQEIPKTVLEEGLHSSEEVRNGVDAELEVLNSLHIEDTSFDPFIQGFREDMEHLGKEFDGQIAIYLDLLKGSRTAEVSDNASGALEAAELRAQAFQERKKEKEIEYQAELDSKRVAADQYRFKLYVLVPVASFYIGGFAVIVILRWKRQVIGRKIETPVILDNAGASIGEPKPHDYEPPE
jgi:hypothetical protein